MMLCAKPLIMPKELAFAQIRSVHIIAGLDPIYGGPSYSVPRLCRALAAAGAEPELLSVAAPAETPGGAHGGYHDRRFPQDYTSIPVLNGLRISSGLFDALRETASIVDLVHNHSS